jgi:hypothetical protein
MPAIARSGDVALADAGWLTNSNAATIRKDIIKIRFPAFTVPTSHIFSGYF